jgi:anti-anti-sigma factor
MTTGVDMFKVLADQAAPFGELEFYREVYTNLPHLAIVYKVIDRENFTVASINPAVIDALGAVENANGANVRDVLPPEGAQALVEALRDCLDKGAVTRGEVVAEMPKGIRWTAYIYTPLRDPEGKITHILSVSEDITEKKRQEEENRQQSIIINRQAEMLFELSTPLLTISDDTVVMPLIGSIDSRRAQQIMENLLTGITEHGASQVILDITGISVMDTNVAAMLIRLAQAVRLLGAQIILTGIRAEIAQTLVSLEIDFNDIITRSTLRDGIAYALGTDL